MLTLTNDSSSSSMALQLVSSQSFPQLCALDISIHSLCPLISLTQQLPSIPRDLILPTRSGFPLGRFPCNFASISLFSTAAFSIRCTWPTSVAYTLYVLANQGLYIFDTTHDCIILSTPFSLTGPYIFLNIFLSKAFHNSSIFHVKIHASEPYAMTLHIRVLYSLIFIFICTSLDLIIGLSEK